MFGNLTVSDKGEIARIDDLLGKQLFSLFAYFVYNHDQTLSKERLISVFWSESKNPENALKNAIFRLRNQLKMSEALKDRELIISTSNGYSFESGDDFYLDVDVFDQAVDTIKMGGNNAEAEYDKIFAIYDDEFMHDTTYDWVITIRTHYNGLYNGYMMKWVNELFEQSRYDKLLMICVKVLSINPFDDEFNYIYLKTLIEVKRYNDAIKYYEHISKLFYQELGIPLLNKIRSLLNIISSRSDENRTNLDGLIAQVEEQEANRGAYYCDYAVFKGLFQLEKRECLRQHNDKYIILLELNSEFNDTAAVYTNRLLDSIRDISRKNDVFSQISKSQVALLVSMKQKEDGFVLIDRIMKDFHRKVPVAKARVNYYLASIMNADEDKKLKNLH